MSVSPPPGEADEVDLSWMDCKIFVDGPSTSAELIGSLAAACSGRALADGVQAKGIELIVSTNDDNNPRLKPDPDSGFLYFAFLVEVYFSPRTQQAPRVKTLATVLTPCGSAGSRRSPRVTTRTVFRGRLGGTAQHPGQIGFERRGARWKSIPSNRPNALPRQYAA